MKIKLQDPQPWLFFIASGLAAIHLILIWRLVDNIDRLSITILVWGAILFLAWERRKNLNLKSQFISSFLGFVLLTLVIVKSIVILPSDQPFLRILPLITFLGMALIASGIKGLAQYWREFILTFLLIVPDGVLLTLFEKLPAINLLTAKYAILLLWYSGFEVSRQGINIIMPTGAVAVYPGCSGFITMILLLKLTTLYLIVFPANFTKAALLTISGVAIAFLVNGFRIALLAVLISYFKPVWFDYWHGGSGSQIFSMISIGIFTLSCNFLMRSHVSGSQAFK